MHVAAVQFDIAWEDKGANHLRIEAMLRAADLEPATFVVLPELGDTGFSFDLDRIVDDRTLPWAQELARARGLWLQVGFALRRRSDTANSFPYFALSTSSLALAYSGQNRMQWPICKCLPLDSAAATMRSHSASVSAMGFSHST